VIFCFDIDGTICKTEGLDYKDSVPMMHRIEKVNELYDKGHTIILLTGRGTETGIDWRDLTSRQMDEWGVKYHDLHLGKPSYDVHIDDKSYNSEAFFSDILEK